MPGHRHRRGDRYLTAGDANAVIGTAGSFFTGTEGSLSMQPHEQDDTGVDVGSNETGSARTSADAGRPGRGLRPRPSGRCLAAFAGSWPCRFRPRPSRPPSSPTPVRALSSAPGDREVGPHGHLWQLTRVQHDGDNRVAIRSRSIQVRVDDFGSNSRPKVSIYTTSSGNPGTSLYVLTNPATLNDDAINSLQGAGQCDPRKGHQLLRGVRGAGIRQ